MLRNVLLALAASLALAGSLPAQEFPKPGPEHDKLKQFEGNWDAVMKMGGQESKATATYKMICGGMWLSSEFQGDLGGEKFQGHGLDGYDLRKKKFVSVWVDSIESIPMHMEGDYDPQSKLVTMTGTGRGPDGQPQKFKNTTEFKDQDHFTFRMYMVGADGKETLAFAIEYSRRKGA